MIQDSRRNELLPPIQSTTPGVGITRIATSTTAAIHDLGGTNFDFFSKRLTLLNESVLAGDNIFLTFSSDGVTPVDATTAGGASPTAGTVAANGFKLLPGASIDVCLSKAKSRFLHVDAAANAPVLAIIPRSTGVGEKVR
jgi:hypothetical protein